MTIVGIDLGTTFSAVAAVREGVPTVLPVGDDTIMPSVVGLTPDNKWIVGQPALNQWVLHTERTVRSIKRKMGTEETVTLGGEVYTPQQISALILQNLHQAAEAALGEAVEQVVITVPAYFSDAARQATRDAGAIAGLEVVRIINEPTAAALAYGFQHAEDEVALVYDLGGGTFDVSVVEMLGGVVDVRASHGNTELGGDDFDERLTRWLVEQFEEKHGVDMRGHTQALARLRRAAEQAKIELSSKPFAWVREEYLMEHEGQPLHMEIEVSRSTFEGLIEELVLETLDSIDRVMDDAELDEVDHVMLVGGSTYIPLVREMVIEHTGVVPRHDVDPSEAVALGASIQGGIIAGEPIDSILVDVTPYSLGIAVVEMGLLGDIQPDRFKPLIRRNTTIPTSHEEVFTTLHPGQSKVRIAVYQGESSLVEDNTLLGDFLIEGLVPDGDELFPHINVLFDIDVNGILEVRAADRGSQKEEGITIQASRQRLSQQEIAAAREAMPQVHQARSLPAEIVAEADTLLSRAALVEQESDVLADAVLLVDEARVAGDEDALREALDELLDVLFELEA